MKRKAFCRSTLLLVAVWGSGCQVPRLLRANTEGIKTTNEAIAGNTTAVAAITQAMQDLGSTLKQESSLKKPMEDLAALGPTFNEVADLQGPLEEVAGLRDPMVRLSALKGSLDQVAKLEKPMSELARLEEPLKAVEPLAHPVSVLARLTPAQLAATGLLTSLGFFTLLFLTIWGAVRLASRHRSV